MWDYLAEVACSLQGGEDTVALDQSAVDIVWRSVTATARPRRAGSGRFRETHNENRHFFGGIASARLCILPPS